MSAVVPSDRAPARRRGPGRTRSRRSTAPSFPKDLLSEEEALSALLTGAPEASLSPLEREILSVCLESPEDPRDIGILLALLSVEGKRRRGRKT